MNKFAVIGAGQMGLGIAQVAAQIAKIPQVIIYDNNLKQLGKQMDTLRSLFDAKVSKGKLTNEEAELTFKALKPTHKLEDLHDANFIVEAIVEDEYAKKSLIKLLSPILQNPQSTILASNTSSISITKLASAHVNPKNFIGMHFMNPVPVMKLVEVIKGCETSEETLKITQDLCTKMGKVMTCSEDVPGFIANRILMPYLNEAIFTLYEGVATRESIDKTMLLGTNAPMGPLALADFIGLDTCLSIMKVLHTEFGDSKYRPCPLLVRYVNAGWLGKKSGKGFYLYSTRVQDNEK